jgi:hypothetical protein
MFLRDTALKTENLYSWAARLRVPVAESGYGILVLIANRSPVRSQHLITGLRREPVTWITVQKEETYYYYQDKADEECKAGELLRPDRYLFYARGKQIAPY